MTKILAPCLAGLLLIITAGCTNMSRHDDPTRDWAALRFYTEGQDALRAENYTQAIDYFKQLQRRYPQDERILPSQLEIAYAWYKLDNVDEAVAAAERYSGAPGNPPHVDYALYLKGLARYQEAMRPGDDDASRQSARLRDAFREFATLTRSHASSKYTEDALQRMVDIRNKLGEIELGKARDALGKGNAAAAVERANHIVEHYENAPAAPQAYALMIDAYRTQGLTDRAINARLELQKKYPDYQYTPAVDSDAPAAVTAPAASAKPATTGQAPAPATPRTAAPATPPQTAPAPAPDTTHERNGTPSIISAPRSPANGSSAATEPQGEEWLLAQPANQYTLQILGTSDKRALTAFIRRHQLHDKTAYFTSKKESGEWYSLLYGTYETQADAQQASSALPAAMRRSSPWIRRYGDVQASIRKERSESSATRTPDAPEPARPTPPLPQSDARDTAN